MDPIAVPAETIADALKRVLSSQAFDNAARSSALLRFVVEQTVNGHADRLKEYTLGAEALGKGEAFDPRTDPIVRAEASRLRTRLERYYANEGRVDPVVIELPKGTYVPQFRPQAADRDVAPQHRATMRSASGAILLTAAILALAAIAITFWSRPPVAASADAGAVTRFDAQLLPGSVVGSEVGTDVVLSPDGRRIVFVTQTPHGESRLNARQLDLPNVVELPGTAGARGPFFSPDGEWVAFWADGKLKKIAVRGGTPQELCPASDLLGGSWGEDGNIVAALGPAQLSRVSSSGGRPTVILDLTKQRLSPRWPQILPGTNIVLFTAVGAAGPNTATIDAIAADGTLHTLVRNATFGRYLASGHLSYVNQGTLFVIRFAADRLEVHGPPRPVLDGVAYSSTFGFAQMDVSRTGTMVYRRSAADGQFVVDWTDATGRISPLFDRPGHYLWPRVSPDGLRVALTSTDGGRNSVWIYDQRRAETTRLNDVGGTAEAPLWTHDGAMLVLGGASGLTVIPARDNGHAQSLLRTDAITVPWSFSPDGHWLAYYRMSSSTAFDIWAVPVRQTGETLVAGAPTPLVQTPAFEVYPAFSPDGHWLAYSSNESGSWEVYVRRFPDDGGKVRVSSAGGRIPLWLPKARELVYETDRQTLMAARYDVSDGRFVVGVPREWIHLRLGDTGVLANFDGAPDGRIAALMPPTTGDDELPSHATFILNFFEMVRRQEATLPK
jgi:serine/threonine-protein kinase